ncbi:MAG: AAA family ATPase [Clostridia bacterium]|nr:AAA family ATPase [Clostridia bacterium]
MGKIIAITSGKGGSGKTLLTAALGMALAEAGKKVCLADGCFGMRGLDMALGAQDKIVFDLADLCDQDCAMEQVLVKLRGGELYLAAAPQWEPELTDKQIARALERLKKRFDYVLLDLPVILQPITGRLLPLADEILLITLPGDLAARNTERAAAMIRELGDLSVTMIMNFFSKGLVSSGRVSPPDALSAYLDIPLAGIVPFSELIYNAAFEGRLLDEYPEKVREAIQRIAKRLDGQSVPVKTYHARRLPWHS